jgi:hypothetical protein
MFVGVVGKQLQKGNRRFGLEYFYDLGNFVLDRNFIGRKFNAMTLWNPFKYFLKGINQFK